MPDLDPIWWATGILAASMPMGANLYLIAEAYGCHMGELYCCPCLNGIFLDFCHIAGELFSVLPGV